MKTKNKKEKINNTQVSLAGEFAVLSQLFLRGKDANMTLGHTEGVDILVSDPETGGMFKLEVKTNHRKSGHINSMLFGRHISDWVMDKKHEQHDDIRDSNLFYCFVNINDDTKQFRFFVVPSKIVCEYVAKSHKLFLDANSGHSRENKIRKFRIKDEKESCPIPNAPTAEKYEDNWNFKK